MVEFILFIVLIISIVIHEVAHGLTAYRYGDPTAKELGRLSLNPVKHVDPLGSLIIPGLLWISGSPFLFGWAKPVPIDPRYFSSPAKDLAKVAFAGPLSNFTLAILASILGFLYKTFLLTPPFSSVDAYVFITLKVFVEVNILLGFFNLLPIPPLDGSRLLRLFLPPSYHSTFDQLERYGFLLIFVFIYLGFFSAFYRYLVFPLTTFFNHFFLN